MNQYSLDYSNRSPQRRPSMRASNRRMRSALRKSGLLLVGLLVGIVLVGLFRLDLTNEQLKRANDQHRLRYDSLLSSKLEAEKQLSRLRSNIDSLKQETTTD